MSRFWVTVSGLVTVMVLPPSRGANTMVSPAAAVAIS
jgi:hypothetical protein